MVGVRYSEAEGRTEEVGVVVLNAPALFKPLT